MIEFQIDIGAGARAITIDPEDITLGFLEDLQEAQDTNKWAPVRSAIASLLKMSRDESRAITLRQFKQIAEAMKNAIDSQATIPNDKR